MLLQYPVNPDQQHASGARAPALTHNDIPTKCALKRNLSWATYPGNK